MAPQQRELGGTVAGCGQPVRPNARRMVVRARSALAVSLAVHAGALIAVVRSGVLGAGAAARLPAGPAPATPRVEIAAVPAPIEVEVLDGPAGRVAPAGPSPERPAGRAGRGAAVVSGSAAAVVSGSGAVGPGEAGGGRPGSNRWFTMRGPDLRLSEGVLERIARGGRAPERVARSGRVESAGGGAAVIHDAVTDITVERDGTVHLHDRPDIDMEWDIHLPTPDRIKEGLAQAGRDVATWYADPYATARVGASQDVPRDIAVAPGDCDHWGDLCSAELRQRYAEVSGLQRQAGGGIGHGKLDLTALLMRKLGVGDAYASRKLDLLDDTRDERAELGARHRAEDLARAAELIQRNLEAMWRATTDPAERRDALFVLWDECAEGDGPFGEAGERARKMVVGWIRARLPAGSPDAFMPDEIARRSAQRRSTQPFVPYE
jgi:hypothetical protein